MANIAQLRAPRSNRILSIGLTLLAIAIDLAFAALALRGVTDKISRAPFALTALPHVVVLLLLLRSREPGPVVWGWVRGVALATIWTLVFGAALGALLVVIWIGALLLPPLLLLLEWSMRIGDTVLRAGGVGALLLVLLGVSQYVASRIAKRERLDVHGEIRDNFQSHQIFAMCLTMIFVVTAGTLIADKARRQQNDPWSRGTRGRDLSASASAVVAVQRCAQLIFDSPGAPGYPKSLNEMTQSGTGCLDSAIAFGSRTGSVTWYSARAMDSSGRVTSYLVMSRDASGRAGTRTYLGDERGRLFETSYDSTWSTRLPDRLLGLRLLHAPGKRLLEIEECIASNYFDSFSTKVGGYPPDLPSEAGYHHPTPHCIADPERNAGRLVIDSEKGQGDPAGPVTFVVSYFPGPIDPRRDSRPNFSLVARPLVYGDGAIASFYVDTAKVLHFTVEQRAATVSDPIVSGCESDALGFCTLETRGR